MVLLLRWRSAFRNAAEMGGLRIKATDWIRPMWPIPRRVCHYSAYALTFSSRCRSISFSWYLRFLLLSVFRLEVRSCSPVWMCFTEQLPFFIGKGRSLIFQHDDKEIKKGLEMRSPTSLVLNPYLFAERAFPSPYICRVKVNWRPPWELRLT